MRSAICIVGLSLLVVCVALGVSQTNAQGKAATTRQAWEYKLVNLLELASNARNDGEEVGRKLESELNTLGADGWELCQNVNNGLVLKRPK